MRSATSSRLTDERYSISSLRRWKPSGVRMISRSTTDSSSSTRQRGPVREPRAEVASKYRACPALRKRERAPPREPDEARRRLRRASEAEQRAQPGLVPRLHELQRERPCRGRRGGGTGARTGAGGRRRGRRARRWTSAAKRRTSSSFVGGRGLGRARAPAAKSHGRADGAAGQHHRRGAAVEQRAAPPPGRPRRRRRSRGRAAPRRARTSPRGRRGRGRAAPPCAGGCRRRRRRRRRGAAPRGARARRRRAARSGS